MPPNACGTLFSIKNSMVNLGRTSTKAYANLESAISTLTALSKQKKSPINCSGKV